MDSSELRQTLNLILTKISLLQDTVERITGQTIEKTPSIKIPAKIKNSKSTGARRGPHFFADGDEVLTEEVKQHLKLYTIKETADKFGVADNTIRAFMKRHGIPTNPSSNAKVNSEQISDILECIRRGDGVADIAEVFGVSSTSVYNIGRNAGIKFNGRNRSNGTDGTTIDYQKMDSMIKNGHSAHNIAKTLKCSLSSVYSRMRHNTTLNVGNVRTEVKLSSIDVK